jgi:hypothetical protein
MTQLKYVGKLNEMYGWLPPDGDGWVDINDETKVYELVFHTDVNMARLIEIDQFGEQLDPFHFWFDDVDGIPSVIVFVSLEKTDLMDDHVFFIDTVKKAIPEILLKQYGIVATPQEYEPAGGI